MPPELEGAEAPVILFFGLLLVGGLGLGYTARQLCADLRRVRTGDEAWAIAGDMQALDWLIQFQGDRTAMVRAAGRRV